MKLVIFDCDGTLVDSQHMIVAAMDRALAEEGFEPLPRDRILSIVGLSLSVAISRLLPSAPSARIEAVADAYKAAFGELRRNPDHHEPLFPGIANVIETLAARDDILLGIATGKSRRGVDALFDRFGFHPHFVTIQTADNNPSKPSPAMVNQALREASVARSATVMIGDTTFDMAMARTAEVGAIGVAWGYHPVPDLVEAGAHDVVHEAERLIGSIDRRLSEQQEAG